MIVQKIFLKQFRQFFFITIAFIVLSFYGCERKSPQVQTGLNDKLDFDLKSYQEQLQSLFTNADSLLSRDSSIVYSDTLRQFYSDRNYQPVFIKNFEASDLIDSILGFLGKANEHGLNPHYYHVNHIRNEFKDAVMGDVQNFERYNHLAKAEIYISDALLKYSSNLRYGVLNPKKIFLDSYYFPITDSSKRYLFQPLYQSSILSYLDEIQPRNRKYKQLQSALMKFESFQNIEWKRISISKPKLKLGDRDSSLIQIAERLITLGILDTSNVKVNDYVFYDSLFFSQIKIFQSANGLIDDGVISKATIEKLNTTPEEYITKIKVNLERFRWFNYSDSSHYILVNIPDYKLYVIENGKEVFDITVCTGRKRHSNFEKKYLFYKENKRWQNKPEDWETPILYSQISHLVLNPTWTVPSSIMREEIASKLRKDSTYLEKANFRVYKDGNKISPMEVNLKDFNTGKIPYIIIQDPGAGNALGKIKFMFDNPFGVYLHDTPTREPFKYANRAVSHGCVRVEKPLKLAEYILANNSKWTIDYLKIEIGLKVDDKSIIEAFRQKRSELRKGSSYGPTTEVKLKSNIPLFIDYYTAWVDENGTVNFRDDVYNQDKIILKNLMH